MIRTILTITILLALSVACNVGQATGYIHFGKSVTGNPTATGYSAQDRLAIEQIITEAFDG